MTKTRAAFEASLQKVGLPEPGYVIGKQIYVEVSTGSFQTQVVSVSNVSGSVELSVAPVYVHGDLVTHIVYIELGDTRIRTTYLRDGELKKALERCSVTLL